MSLMMNNSTGNSSEASMEIKGVDHLLGRITGGARGDVNVEVRRAFTDDLAIIAIEGSERLHLHADLLLLLLCRHC